MIVCGCRGQGWVGPGCGGPADCGPGADSGFGFGFGGPGGFGFGHRLKRASLATAAMLLDGPADAAQIVQRISAADRWRVRPAAREHRPRDRQAGRTGVHRRQRRGHPDRVGRNVLGYRGITSQTAQSMLARVGQFADVIKIRAGLGEIAGLARTIMWSGTRSRKPNSPKSEPRWPPRSPTPRSHCTPHWRRTRAPMPQPSHGPCNASNKIHDVFELRDRPMQLQIGHPFSMSKAW